MPLLTFSSFLDGVQTQSPSPLLPHSLHPPHHPAGRKELVHLFRLYIVDASERTRSSVLLAHSGSPRLTEAETRNRLPPPPPASYY